MASRLDCWISLSESETKIAVERKTLVDGEKDRKEMVTVEYRQDF